MNASRIISISGPSGAGKTELVRWMLKIFARTALIPSYTIRPARSSDLPGEYVSGLSVDEFNRLKERNEFAWYIDLFGNQYGTRSEDIYQAVIRIDTVNFILVSPDTIYNLRQHAWSYSGDVHSLYIDCENEGELRRRLTLRDKDPELVERRIVDSRVFREKAKAITGLVWIDNSSRDDMMSARLQILDYFVSEGFFPLK